MKAYKTEINPTEEQKQIIHQTIGVCRFIYNFYLGHNKEIYEKENRFVSGMEFSKWLNNEFIPNNLEYIWIKKAGSKAIKKSIMDAELAFKRFFNGKSKFPRFKKKGKSDVKAYFPKNNKTDFTVERHRIKIPTLGFVRLKEKGGVTATRQNIQKQIAKVQKLHQRISNTRQNYINQTVNTIVKQKPSYITIEDLNVRGMMKNKHLARVVSEQNFYGFRVKLTDKCKLNSIELRVVDRFFPSSKMCSCCGSINLANAEVYKVA